MFPYKAVFSDIDGTLVDAEHHAMPASAGPIVRLVAAGVPFVLISSRGPGGIAPVQRELGFQGPYVAYGGALVRDACGRELFSKTIGIDAACEIKDFLTTELPQVFCCTYGFDTWVVDDDSDPRVREEEYFVRDKSVVDPDLRGRFGERGVHKFMLMGEPGAILAAEREVARRFPELAVVRSRAELCEIGAGGVSKGAGVRLVCEHLGVDPADCAGFGDGLNDLDLMAAVGTSVAMANAEEAVKARATHVTRWSNVEMGVSRTLEALGA